MKQSVKRFTHESFNSLARNERSRKRDNLLFSCHDFTTISLPLLFLCFFFLPSFFHSKIQSESSPFSLIVVSILTHGYLSRSRHLLLRGDDDEHDGNHLHPFSSPFLSFFLPLFSCLFSSCSPFSLSSFQERKRSETEKGFS